MSLRQLTQEDILKLKKQGCSSTDWTQILISPELNLSKIHNVRFTGPISIYEGVELRDIPTGISGCTIRANAVIENIGSIRFEPDAKNGVGTMVSVLDETGSRPVCIYPGISSQIATLMARVPNWLEKITPNLKGFLDSRIPPSEIGEKAVIKNCGTIKNVSIGSEVVIDGASRLENGAILNNAAPGKCFTYIGSAVEAENFIIEDAKVESKSSLVNCYVGQGSVLSHGFSAHDCLFFSNCAMEYGEAHALLAGPYTVSLHKGTLLIGCQTSFMNAGSLTNQSNHMYKLGPIHWGILERGVKTSSSSYLMLGAKIGPFSLLMGSHKTHPDSSDFPFSYLFSDEKGHTIVIPAIMLRSCGLQRDAKKWPARDKREGRGLPLYDHIHFEVLNPYTVDSMLRAIEIIDKLLARPSENDLSVTYKGMKFTVSALERAKDIYRSAIFKYLSLILPSGGFPENDGKAPGEWVDLGGQILPRTFLDRALACDNIMDAETIFTEADMRYPELQLKWVARRFGDWWRNSQSYMSFYASQYDEMVEEDRQQYLKRLDEELEMLAL